MARDPRLARRLFDRFEPVHAVTYFAPEARAALTEAGFRGFWMGYFAARSAPLGTVPAEVVTALFYNFAPAHVARALPAAWDLCSPGAALQARAQSAVTALHRYGVRAADDTVAVAADLLRRAALSAGIDGRPLYAANRALDFPVEPLAALWHATTLLREHRGDGHIAALVAADISGREANVLHAAAGSVPVDFIVRSRSYDDTEWRDCCARLAGRGLLDRDGALTAAGAELKEQIETLTDTLALAPYAVLDDDEVERLFTALTPITRAVVAAGDVPVATPMGLRRHELHDDHAHQG